MSIHRGVSGKSLSGRLECGGRFYVMGDGIFVLRQRNPTAGRRAADSVVVTRQDLEARSAPVLPLTEALEDGKVFDMGEGIFIAAQRDGTLPGHPVQRVLFTANDTARMLAAA